MKIGDTVELTLEAKQITEERPVHLTATVTNFTLSESAVSLFVQVDRELLPDRLEYNIRGLKVLVVAEDYIQAKLDAARKAKTFAKKLKQRHNRKYKK